MRSLNLFFITSTCFLFSQTAISGEVQSWECDKFNGAIIIASDGTKLGILGESWKSNSIFNSSSKYSSSWSSESIFNDSSDYSNSYSNLSVFNESASDPPRILNDGEFIGYISVGPSWKSDRYNPYDIKYTCDWD